MHDDNLPVGPGDGRLPAHADPRHNALAQQRPGAISLDFQDERQTDPDEIDLLAYWRILVKRRWLILGTVAAVAALALLVTMMTTPIYRASVMLQLENRGQQVVQMGDVGGGVGGWGGWDPSFLSTQYELLQSRALAERVADELDMSAAAMARLQPQSWLQRLQSLVRPPPEPAVDENTSATTDADPKAAESRRSAVAGMIRGGLQVVPVPDSQLVRVSFNSPVPQFAARAANAIADGFIASDLERRFGATSYAKTYLEEQLALIKARLEQSERELVTFAQKENLVSTGEDGQSLVGQNLSSLNQMLSQAQSERIRTQSRWQAAQSSGAGAVPADILGNSQMPILRQQRAELQRTYQKQLQVFKPDYPEMQQLQSQLDALDKQIGAEMGNIRASIKAEYDAAVSRENLLVAQLGTLRDETLDVAGRSIQYNILRREVDTNRELYDGLLQRFKEIGVAGDVRSNNISIIDRALVPGSPYKPSVSRNLALGLLLGLMLGVLIAFVLEFLDDTLKVPDDIEQKLKLPVLGIIPKLAAKQTPAQASRDLRSAFSEAYRSVRTALQFATDQGVPKLLLITSAGPGEGKSTSALALARNFAALGKRVLLIDGDLRNPSLRRVLNASGDVGLSNLLAGAATLQEVVVHSQDIERLDMIFAGPLPPNPAELLSGSRLVSLLSITREHYDQVIIDGPPVMGIADAPLLANAVDATLLVVSSGSTKITTAQTALKRLSAARARVLGALLTKYDAKVAGYGYQYDDYYSYGGPKQLAKR